ncbi:MAG: flagellar basal body rod protein FlgB [Archangium sp.]|nr:flagellar basal body rod protein FlgB [Archangium sp.]
MKLFDTTLTKLQSALDVRLERQNVLNGNLANLDTPGYSPRELDFDKALAAAVASPKDAGAPAPVASHEGFLPVGNPDPVGADSSAFIHVATELQGGLDGNGVDLDKTMVELARNSLLYGAAAKAVGKKLALLRYVATDGVG